MQKYFLISLALFITIQLSAQTSETSKILDELTQLSNDYSGIYNSRQTWNVSYEGCKITDHYYFNDELTLTVELDLADMNYARIEKRFYNSIAVYPKDKNPEYLHVTRYEDGKASRIVDGIYYSLMVPADNKEKAHKLMNEAIESCQE